MPVVLVENFDVKQNRMEYPRQEICTLSPVEIQKLLDSIDLEDQKKAPIPVRIVSDYYIIQKLESDRYFYRRNLKGYTANHKADQTTLIKILEGQKKPVLVPGLLPLLTVFSLVGPLIMIFGLFYLIPSVSIQNPEIMFTLVGIMFVISCFSAVYAIGELARTMKGKKTIPVEHTLLYVEDFLQWDISLYILLILQSLIFFSLPILLIFLGHIVTTPELQAAILIDIGVITLVFLTVIFFVGPLDDYFRMYREERLRKERILRHLVKRINTDPEEKRTYLYTAYQLVEARHWHVTSKIPKLFALLSLISPVITTLIQIFK